MAELEAWASVDDVMTFTAYEASDDEVMRAQDIVELFAGITWLATDNLSQTNLRMLNRAVAYQTAWMSAHPDIYTHVDVDSVSADGQSHTPGHVNAALLAPLAHRCLRRLTWRLKPLRLRRRYGQYDYDDRGPRDSAVADDNRAWYPIP